MVRTEYRRCRGAGREVRPGRMYANRSVRVAAYLTVLVRACALIEATGLRLGDAGRAGMTAGEAMGATVDVTVGLVAGQHAERARGLAQDLLEIGTATARPTAHRRWHVASLLTPLRRGRLGPHSWPPSSDAEHRLDARRQFFDLERLAQGFDVAVRLELGRGRRVHQGADDEHLRSLAVVGADALEDLRPAQLPGQHEVEEDEVRLEFVEEREALVARLRHLHLVPFHGAEEGLDVGEG